MTLCFAMIKTKPCIRAMVSADKAVAIKVQHDAETLG